MLEFAEMQRRREKLVDRARASIKRKQGFRFKLILHLHWRLSVIMNVFRCCWKRQDFFCGPSWAMGSSLLYASGQRDAARAEAAGLRLGTNTFVVFQVYVGVSTLRFFQLP